jgi:signal transduction histidine kinase/CheY-like chemotaxis protein/HPt (histidine-containing phosphotransfer) domain-containing protein
MAINPTKKESLNFLSTITEAIATAGDPQLLADALFKVVDEFINVPYSSIFLWDFKENRLRLYANKGFSEEDKIYSENSAMERHPGWVFTNREPLVINDMQTENVPYYVKSGKREFEVRSRLWMPISTEDKSLGAFGFASSEPNFFTEEYQSILRLCCRLAGNILSNIIFVDSEKKYVEEIELSMKQLQNASNAQQNFIAKMSHEMRTPLNGIIGMAKLLSKISLEEKQRNYLDIISDQSNLLLNLINDILDISKIQTEDFNIVDFPFNLEETINTVLKSQKFQADQKGIRLKFLKDSEVVMFVSGDSLRFAQILTNLISNAIKFTAKGEVRLSLSVISSNSDNELLSFSLKDSGIGIEESKLKTIFEKFTQADDSISRTHGGSGLGLYIVKELISKMGGNITVQSTLGKGSEFTFEIPFRINKEIKQQQNYEEIVVFENAKLLIVEDNAVNLIYLETILGDFGFDIDKALDGIEAVQKCRDKSYDLILMDLQMPRLDGISASKIIRNELNLKTPILAQSANTVQKDIDSCYLAGINAYIAKPFTIDQLIDKLKIFLRHSNGSNTENLNVKKLAMKYAHKKEDADQLYTLFVHTATQDLNSMKILIESESWTELKAFAHKLKGSFAVFEITEAMQICSKIENSKEVNPDEIKLEFERLLQIVKLYLSDERN